MEPRKKLCPTSICGESCLLIKILVPSKASRAAPVPSEKGAKRIRIEWVSLEEGRVGDADAETLKLSNSQTLKHTCEIFNRGRKGFIGARFWAGR